MAQAPKKRPVATEPSKLSILLVGDSTGGKTASLRNMDHVLYLDCENMKEIPISLATKEQFTVRKILKPQDVIDIIKRVTRSSTLHAKAVKERNPKPPVDLQKKYKNGIAIDSMTFLLDMFVTQNINANHVEDTRTAWGNYTQFILDIMDAARPLKIPLIVTAHLTKKDNSARGTSLAAAVQGKIGNGQGLESFFSTIVEATVVTLDELEEPHMEINKNHFERTDEGYLNVSNREKLRGRKHVFKVEHFADDGDANRTVLRAPFDMWNEEMQYMDNDVLLLIKKIKEHYSK